MTTSVRPVADEHSPYYDKYIALVSEPDAVTALERQLEELLLFFRGLSEAQGALRYAPGKWSIKQVIGHISDGERVFAYRALRFARADATPLPGFDENIYAANGGFDQLPLASLVDGLEAVRRSSIALFRTLDDAAWMRRGKANDAEISVRALAYVIAGHARHHVGILKERYLAAK